MKRMRLIIIAIIVGLGVMILGTVYTVYYVQSEKGIPLLEAVEFGMPYSDLCAQYGSAALVTENYCETEHTAYSYELPLFGKNSEVLFQFYMDKLDRVDLVWEHPSTEDAQETYLRVKNQMIDELGWRFSFHLEEDTHTDTRIRLYFLRNSGREIRYDLSVKDTKVYVICRSTQ